jgi:hypothetical protein
MKGKNNTYISYISFKTVTKLYVSSCLDGISLVLVIGLSMGTLAAAIALFSL